MNHRDKMWVVAALSGVTVIGLLVMLCGLGLSLGYRTLSVISFGSVIVLLGTIAFIRRLVRARRADSD